MAVEVAVFTPKPPVNLFESARRQVGTTFETLIQPTLYAEVDNLGQVQRLRNTTAVLTAMRLHNSSASTRTVDFQVRSSRRVTYQAEVTAVAGENWIRLDRTTDPRGVSVFGWDWSQNTPVRLANEPQSLSTISYCVDWTSDSSYLSVASDVIRILDADDDFSPVYTAPSIGGNVTPLTCAWSSDDRYLAATYQNVTDPSLTPYLRVFDFADKTDPVEVTLPSLSSVLTQTPQHISWVGRFLAVGGASPSQPVLVLDWDTGSPVYDATLSAALSDGAANRDIRGMAFSPDGGRFAVAFASGDRLRVYAMSGATATRINDAIFAINTQRVPGLSVAWSADSRYLTCLSAATSDAPFTVYDFDSGVSLRPAPANLPLLPPLRRAAWSPDGRYLCVGHSESTRYTYYPSALPYLLLYDYQSGFPVRVLNNPSLQGFGSIGRIAWAPDGDTLMVAGFAYDRFYPPTGVDNVRLQDSDGVNYLINGSFEDQTGSTRTSFGFTAVGSIPNWFVEDGPEAVVFFPDKRFVNAFATDGSVYLDMVSSSPGNFAVDNSARLRQNLTTLSEGETYLLSVDVTASQESIIGLRVLWNGTPVNINGETTLPIIEDFLLLPVTVPPGESLNVDLNRHMLAYGDALQLRASGGSVDATASYILSTQEFIETINAPPPPEEEPTE